MKDFAKSIRIGNSNKAEIIEKKKKEGATLKVDNGQKLEFSDGSTFVKTSFSDDYREAHNYVGNSKVGNSFESAKSEYEKAVREIESELKSAKPNIDKYFQIKERVGRTLSSERNNIQKELSAKINELINMESNIGHLEDKFYK